MLRIVMLPVSALALFVASAFVHAWGVTPTALAQDDMAGMKGMAGMSGMEDMHETFYAGEPGDPKLPARTIEVTMTEGEGTMGYAPAEIDVKQGEQIKFIIKNAGTLKHEFHLGTLEENAHHESEMQAMPGMQHDDPNARSVEPGKQAEILWKFSKAGIFEFACLVPGHYEAGMHGKIVVK